MRVEKEGENKSLKSHGSRGRSPSITGRGEGVGRVGMAIFGRTWRERPPGRMILIPSGASCGS